MTFEFLKKTGRAVALTSALVAAVSLTVVPSTAQAAWRGGGGGWQGGRGWGDHGRGGGGWGGQGGGWGGQPCFLFLPCI
jgi:hypothetical protein